MTERGVGREVKGVGVGLGGCYPEKDTEKAFLGFGQHPKKKRREGQEKNFAFLSRTWEADLTALPGRRGNDSSYLFSMD